MVLSMWAQDKDKGKYIYPIAGNYIILNKLFFFSGTWKNVTIPGAFLQGRCISRGKTKDKETRSQIRAVAGPKEGHS